MKILKSGDIMNTLEKLNKAFVKNAVKEMREIADEINEYADLLETTEIDVEQEALIKNFERKINHVFHKVILRV